MKHHKWREQETGDLDNVASTDDYVLVEDEGPVRGECLTGVVVQKYRVISYMPATNVLVYERDGKLIQTNALDYDGSGYIYLE